MTDNMSSSQVSGSTVAENIALVSRIGNEIWNKGDMAVCDAVFSADYIGHLPGTPAPVCGPREFGQLVQLYRTAFPDVHLTIEDVFAAGDRVAMRWTSRGTNLGSMMGVPPTGRRIEIMGVSIFRIAQGKVVEEWEGFDTMALMQQLGAMGAPQQ
jgi:steroid delta-isomerase-like uncharacterized protein